MRTAQQRGGPSRPTASWAKTLANTMPATPKQSPRAVAVQVLDGGLVAPGDLVARQAEDGGDGVALLGARCPPAQHDRHHPLLVLRGLVEGLLKHMGVRAQVGVRVGAEPITLDISGRDLGALIGWRGETLRALQSVTNVMVGKHLDEGERIIVDVERYRQRREHTVREIAMRAARQVKMTGDAITLDAMQPFERRAIHLALEGDPEVTSSSIGEEPDRRVVVGPRKAAEQ